MNKTQTFKIETYPWSVNGYQPTTTIEFYYDDYEFKIHFTSFENPVRAVETESNSSVCCDSCVEFFAQFDPKNSPDYINFEMNPNGALLCQKGSSRYDRTFIDSSVIETFKRKTDIHSDFWEAQLAIPLTFIKNEFPRYKHCEGTVILANFYKCGEKTLHPHHGCWNRVETKTPDFHRPEFFKAIVL